MSSAIGIKQVILSAYTQRSDAKGIINDDYIYSIKFDREKMSKVDWNEDLSKIFFAFENICEVRADKTFKTITPFDMPY